MSATEHPLPPHPLRSIERLTEGVCPHCKLPLIRGDTVTMGMDGKTWHAGCVEQLARSWKRGKRSWRP